jgi:hypothetical protein
VLGQSKEESVSRSSRPHPNHTRPDGGEAAPGGLRSWVLTRPLLTYFAAAYALTLLAAVLVYGPTLLGQDTPSGQLWRALAAFPLMVIGVGAAGITLTTITAGRRGRRELWARMRPGQAAARWYAVVLLPPAAILAVLLLLRAAAATAYAPRAQPVRAGVWAAGRVQRGARLDRLRLAAAAPPGFAAPLVPGRCWAWGGGCGTCR